jgi:predicted dinucleotide-binding enzyme
MRLDVISASDRLTGGNAVATTLGLIGAGRIGSTLAKLAVAADLEVVLSNSRGPDTLADLVSELGPKAKAATVDEAAAADLIAIAVPLGSYGQLPAAALAGKTVIDANNYYPDRDGRIPDLDSGAVTSSELVQRQLPGALVVKAFNNIDSMRLGKLARPAGAPDRSALPIAGDDPEAKARVAALLDVLGYDAVDVGTLADSWRSQPDTPVYVRPYFPHAFEAAAEGNYERFLNFPGVAVPADQVKELLGAATR